METIQMIWAFLVKYLGVGTIAMLILCPILYYIYAVRPAQQMKKIIEDTERIKKLLESNE